MEEALLTDCQFCLEICIFFRWFSAQHLTVLLIVLQKKGEKFKRQCLAAYRNPENITPGEEEEEEEASVPRPVQRGIP